MKVLLIFTNINSTRTDEYNFGLGYISSFIKQKGYESKCYNVSSLKDFDHVRNLVADFKPDVIGFSSVETQFIHVVNLSRLLRCEYKGIMVCGGVFLTICPEAIRYAEALDGGMMGEGELAFLELLENVKNNRDWQKTKNLCYYDKEKKKIIKNDLVSLISDLDSLPFPDRDMFDYEVYLKGQQSIQFLFNRGCPFRCTYCSNHAVAKVYGRERNFTRFRTVGSCIEEIDFLLTKYKTGKPLHFVDDLFIINRGWVLKFLAEYKKCFKRPFMCHVRSDIVTRELFANLKEAGCYRVMMSIESGNDFIRNEIMKRDISRKQLLDSFKWARAYGIETSGVGMVGLPFETKEAVWDTLKTMAATKTTSFMLNVFYPYRGTYLYDVCKKNNFLPQNDNYLTEEVKERRESILNLPSLSKDDIRYFANNCESLVMKYRPFREKLRFYAKDVLGKMLRKMGILDRLRDNELFIKIRKLIYS